MKAYEWASKFQASKDIFATVEEFVLEANALIESRTKTSKGERFVKSAAEGAIREVANKWRAITNRCPRISIFSFDQILKQMRAVASEKTHKYVAA